MFILDTNVVSELRKAGDGKADPMVVSWLSLQDTGNFYVSIITIMELDLGIIRMERKDPRQGSRLRSWMTNHVLPAFAGRTIMIDHAVARECAALHADTPRPERDALIAACALAHRMTVVTRNTIDFGSMNVDLINPWNVQPRA